MIRTHKDDPPLTGAEAAELARITALACLRRGVYTTRQQKRIDRILDGARKRQQQDAKK